jgi:alanine dehydrogenase
MKPRSVIIDVAIDQGGSCETSRPTSHHKPTYLAEGVLHYCVPNMPGAYARTSTQALTHSTLPYISLIARLGVPEVFAKSPSLAKGLQCFKGYLTSLPVAQAQQLRARSLLSLGEGS